MKFEPDWRGDGGFFNELAKAREALNRLREYQRLWLENGSDRVYEIYDDVDGDWLENWEEIDGDS